MTVGSAMLQRPSAAGGFALSIVPSGSTTSSGRKQPSLTSSSGDVIALPASGAYNLAMASNYNLAPKPAAVLVADGKARLMPVAILVDGKFYDANLYRATPRPMAVDPEIIYDVLQEGKTIGTFTVGLYPEMIAFDGTNMWVTHQSSGTVIELSPSGATLATFAVGGAEQGIAFDGMNMWDADFEDGTVIKL